MSAHRRCLALGLWALGWLAGPAVASAWAQAPAIDWVAEASRLAEERADLDARRRTGRARCHQLFSVNSCLTEVERQYRAERKELDRQQRLLNDQARRDRSSRKVLSLEEKAQTAADTAQQRAEASNAVPQGTDSQLVAPAPGPMREPKVPKSAPAPSKPRLAHPPKSSPATADPAGVAENQAAYRQKLDEQAQRKASAEQRRRERTKPLAAPLPPALPSQMLQVEPAKP